MEKIEKEGSGRSFPLLKRRVLGLAVAGALMGISLFVAGCAGDAPSAEQPSEDPAKAQQLAETDWSLWAPKVVTKEDGTQVQKTPYGGMPNGYFMPEGWDAYNTYVLNADNRGCSSCHDLADALMGDLGHWLYYGNYDNESIRYDDCFGCHEAYGVSLQEFQTYMHSHMDKPAFKEMGGNCNSCHYESEDGQYLIWDDVKYDVMHGITDLAAEDVDAAITWNQDEITPVDKMFVQKKLKLNWGFDVVPKADDIRDTYTVKFTGDIDNPMEMTIQQMIDEFGTETRVTANHCTINGTGGSYIYQAEVTGIPMSKIMEKMGIHDDANMFHAIGIDGYDIPMYTSVCEANDPLLVFEMNGEELEQSQGYPIALWMGGGISGGQFTRYLSEIQFSHSDDPGGAYNGFNQGVFGDYNDPRTGKCINTPNIGVLTEETGTIFKLGEPVHFEGYAHAFDETVTKLEFSFDRGATWKEVPVDNTDNSKWVYWKMDVNNLNEPGSYLLRLRATSVGADGEEHVNDNLPEFLINIQE